MLSLDFYYSMNQIHASHTRATLKNIADFVFFNAKQRGKCGSSSSCLGQEQEEQATEIQALPRKQQKVHWNLHRASPACSLARTRKLLASLGRARWTASATHMGHRLATTGWRLQRPWATGYHMHHLRTTGHRTSWLASKREEALRSAAGGQIGHWAVDTGPTAYGLAVGKQRALWTAAAGHIIQRLTGYRQAGAGDDGRYRDKTGALARSGHIVHSGRTPRGRTVAGHTVEWLAAGGFHAGLLAVVGEPGLVLTTAGYIEDISAAPIGRAEGHRW